MVTPSLRHRTSTVSQARASALAALDVVQLTPETICDTLGVLLKYQDDIARLTAGETARLLDEARARAAA